MTRVQPTGLDKVVLDGPAKSNGVEVTVAEPTELVSIRQEVLGNSDSTIGKDPISEDPSVTKLAAWALDAGRNAKNAAAKAPTAQQVNKVFIM